MINGWNIKPYLVCLSRDKILKGPLWKSNVLLYEKQRCISIDTNGMVNCDDPVQHVLIPTSSYPDNILTFRGFMMKNVLSFVWLMVESIMK